MIWECKVYVRTIRKGRYKSRVSDAGFQFYLKQQLTSTPQAKRMKILITGAFLLVLTFTITDALDKKQNDGCLHHSDELRACLDAAMKDDGPTLCSSSCKSILTEYFRDCSSDATLEQFRQEYHQRCGAVATVVTLFVVVSAVLVAMFN